MTAFTAAHEAAIKWAETELGCHVVSKVFPNVTLESKGQLTTYKVYDLAWQHRVWLRGEPQQV